MQRSTVENVVLEILERVSGSPEVRHNLDIALFDKHLIDSFDAMEMIVELSDTLQIEISPAEVERDAWSTPRKIIALIEMRVENRPRP